MKENCNFKEKNNKKENYNFNKNTKRKRKLKDIGIRLQDKSNKKRD